MEVSSLLTTSLADSPHSFLQPSLPLYTDTLAYLKHTLDPVAANISAEQQQRQQDARKKRKRGQKLPEHEVLRLKQVHIAGFTVEQVWEQARRVIDAATVEAERGLEDAEAREVGHAGFLGGLSGHLEDGLGVEEGESSLGEEGVDYEVEGLDEDGEDWEDAGETGGLGDDAQQALNGDDDIDMDDEADMYDENIGNDEPPDEFVSDKFGLNDGFFSIDDFNRKSEFLEQQDARGDDDGAASDEEEVDWDADPSTQAGIDAEGDGANGESEDEADEEGPGFGDPDALSEDEDGDLDAGEMDALGGMANTNNVMYADFFAPPAQKKRKNKKGRPNPHNFPTKTAESGEADEGDMERTMAAVHRDLFEDEASEPEEDIQETTVDASDPKSRRSTHERRQAALAAEIRKLEAANVAKREWTLSGEARAADRPLNSLLEEDLDFERAGKPVPVITAEVSESIEELIKRRILAHEFEDIIRRRPDDLATGKDGRRGRLDFVLDDSKSKKGLAEEYEEEHLRRTDPNYTDAQSEKQKKEEKEISALWQKISADLDSLSSWHFRPKRPAPQMEIRVDAPVVTLEDARPAAGGEVAGASALAPQEVHKAVGNGPEVVGRSGLPAAREEMGRDERKRRRRREKERGRKAGGNDGASQVRKSEKEKNVVGDLKRGGVKVIGKKGGVTDVEGKEIRDFGGQGQGVGRYKL